MAKIGWRKLSSIAFYFLALFLIVAPASSLAVISKISPSPTPTLTPTPSPTVSPSPSASPIPSASPVSKLDQSQRQTVNTNSLAIYDVSGDRIISSEDLVKVKNNFTDKCQVPCQYDFTGDGKVTEADAAILREHSGKTVLDTTPKRTVFDGFVPGELLVKFDSSISESKKAQIYQENRLKRLGDLGRLDSDHIQFRSQNIDQLIENLQKYPEVVMVGKNTLAKLNYIPNDPEYSRQWNLAMIKMPQAWDQTRGLPSVKIAIVDTGVGPHADLNGKIVPGYNAVDENTDTQDVAGHGTQVAGIAAATTDNGQGIAGVGFYATILPLRACIPYLTVYTCPESYTARALEWLNGNVLVNGEKVVINMSYGSSGSRPFDKAALDMAVRLGAIPVAVAGNEGTNQINYPARYDNVIAVGAVNRDGTRWASSNYGSELDVVAPHNVWTTTLPTSANFYRQYGYFDGTSAAAPQVAGVAALYYAVGVKPPWVGWQNNFELFLNWGLMATDLGPAGRDDYYGKGLIDAYRTLRLGGCAWIDFNQDKVIDVVDQQMISFRYGASLANNNWGLYETKYDLEPWDIPDGDIDILDLQTVYGRAFMLCQ